MKSLLRHSPTTLPTSPRGGVSLTEVLMSLMIMSIGVVSLITLFPISTLRVIEATHMTNATVLRYDAEAFIDSQTNFVFDPDPNQAAAREHLGESYLVDPLGFAALKAAGVAWAAPANPAWTFGYNTPASVTIPLPRRYPGIDENTLTEAVARTLVSLPDSFSEQGDGLALAGTATSTSVTVDANMDLSSVTPSAQVPYIAVLFDPTGDISEVRTLDTVSQPAPHVLTWTQPLPSTFTDIGRVQVLSNEEFYTWMLTVRRRASGPAKVDVVVFIKRLIAAADITGDGTLDGNQDEQVYSGKLVRFVPGTNNENNQVTITFTAGNPPKTAKRGAHIFDTRNCLWYRISSIPNETATQMTFVLEESVRRDNTEDLNLNGSLDTGEDTNSSNSMDEGGIIIPRGVISVFPLELKLPAS